ncbi:hypothetical protein ACHWQZ_G008574 [Mnemiopsis leidyi]
MLFLLIFLSSPGLGVESRSSTLTIYEHANQRGKSLDIHKPEPSFYNLGGWNWDNKISSVLAEGGSWELYTDANYGGERMAVPRGQAINVKHNDKYSSARPTCNYFKDPDTAKLVVYEYPRSQGDKRVFYEEYRYLGSDWNDVISSFYAEKGDWELYEHKDFQGKREVVLEGQSRDLKINNRASSLRPLCETYKMTCRLQKVATLRKGPLDFRPQYEATEIIGSQDGGSCTGDGISTLSLHDVDRVEEYAELTIDFESTDGIINWSKSSSVEVETSEKLLGSGSPRSATFSQVEGSHVLRYSRLRSFSSENENSVPHSVQYKLPGAAIIFQSVDRYAVDSDSLSVKLYLDCPDGTKPTKESTSRVRAVRYQSAHAWFLTGEFSEFDCTRDMTLPDCVRAVRERYFDEKEEINAAFRECFTQEKGVADM